MLVKVRKLHSGIPKRLAKEIIENQRICNMIIDVADIQRCRKELCRPFNAQATKLEKKVDENVRVLLKSLRNNY